jgi:hypothetical protein
VGLFLQQREQFSMIRSKQDLVYDLTEPWICKSPKPDSIPPVRAVANNTLPISSCFFCNSVPERSTTPTYFQVEKDPCWTPRLRFITCGEDRTHDAPRGPKPRQQKREEPGVGGRLKVDLFPFSVSLPRKTEGKKLEKWNLKIGAVFKKNELFKQNRRLLLYWFNRCR